MSSREMHHKLTPGVRWVDHPVTILPQGAGTPLLGEGDPNGAYFTVTRTSAGVYVLTTKDPYLAVVNIDASVSQLAAGAWTTELSALAQNANNTWSVTITALLAGTATDLAANAANRIFVWFTFRNGGSLP